MKKYKVKTPNPAFSGIRHGVRFFRGEAIAEFPAHVVNDFKAWGYEVEEIKEKKEAPKKPQPKEQTKKKEK